MNDSAFTGAIWLEKGINEKDSGYGLDQVQKPGDVSEVLP